MVAAIRLEDYADRIETTLVQALADPTVGPEKNSNLQNPLATSKWEKVSWNLHQNLKYNFCSSIGFLT